MLCEPEILAYRSSAPVDGRLAGRLAETVLRPAERRDWASPPPGRACASGAALPRFLFGEVWLDSRSVHADVLWLICQLARFARDEHLEFEIQLGAIKGRVSTGGLDAGAQEILLQAQGKESHRPMQLRRRQRRASRARAG
jgi:hypothetical protein